MIARHFEVFSNNPGFVLGGNRGGQHAADKAVGCRDAIGARERIGGCDDRWGIEKRAEFLLEKGAIDMIVHRRQMRDEIAQLLALLQRQPSEALA